MNVSPVISLRLHSEGSQSMYYTVAIDYGTSRMFINDTGNTESIMLVQVLVKLSPGVLMKRTESTTRGVTARCLNSLGEFELRVLKNDGDIAEIRLLISREGLFILGLKAIQRLKLSSEFGAEQSQQRRARGL